jgi:hypothetical protein
LFHGIQKIDLTSVLLPANLLEFSASKDLLASPAPTSLAREGQLPMLSFFWANRRVEADGVEQSF